MLCAIRRTKYYCHFSDENVFKCKIISINDQSIEIKLVEKQQINTELPQNITICSGLIKADKYEWMIQKATEMGQMSL